MPVGPNYASVLAGDPANVERRYMRAFNTGLPRNTGRLRIRGINYAQLRSSVANATSAVDGHAGGVSILIKVPGKTGWLDIGRDFGVPGSNTALDWIGCKTTVMPDQTSNDFTLSYNTVAATSNNGIGEYPIFILVVYFKNGVGETVKIDDITWEAP